MRHDLVQLQPPAFLLREVVQPTPPSEGAVNLDLLLYAVDLELALAEANNDKTALREFLQSPP